MSFDTVASTKIYISPDAPATLDKVGFEALIWTLIGEVTDVPSVVGREYNTSTHSPVTNPQVTEKKGSYKLPNAEIQCAWDEDDAGQKLVQADADTYNTPSFKLVKQNGAIRYFTAQVGKFVENNGTVDNVVTGAITLLRQTDSIKVAPPAGGG